MWEPEKRTQRDLRTVAANDAQSRPTVRPLAKASDRFRLREHVACDLSRRDEVDRLVDLGHDDGALAVLTSDDVVERFDQAR